MNGKIGNIATRTHSDQHHTYSQTGGRPKNVYQPQSQYRQKDQLRDQPNRTRPGLGKYLFQVAPLNVHSDPKHDKCQAYIQDKQLAVAKIDTNEVDVLHMLAN